MASKPEIKEGRVMEPRNFIGAFLGLFQIHVNALNPQQKVGMPYMPVINDCKRTNTTSTVLIVSDFDLFKSVGIKLNG